MSFSAIAVVLAILWATITDTFTFPNLALGFAIGAAVALVVRDRFRSRGTLRRLWAAFALGVIFLRDLLVSAVKVGLLVLSPNLRRKLAPAIIAYPLRLKSDAGITLLANLITLTPGTLSIDVSEDRTTLYVHALQMTDRDGLVSEIANGFERRIMDLLP